MVRVGRRSVSFTLLPPRPHHPLTPHSDGRVAVPCRPLPPLPFLPHGPTKLLDRGWGPWPLPVPVHSPALRPFPPPGCVGVHPIPPPLQPRKPTQFRACECSDVFHVAARWSGGRKAVGWGVCGVGMVWVGGGGVEVGGGVPAARMPAPARTTASYGSWRAIGRAAGRRRAGGGSQPLPPTQMPRGRGVCGG